MKWLLDTNVVWETIRPRPDPAVVSWIEAHPLDDLGISIVTMAELQEGAASAGGEGKDRLTQWLKNIVVPSFGERTLPLTLSILVESVRLSRMLAAERAIHRAADLLIAATARWHGLVVVTRNLRDFAPTKVAVYDPWTGTAYNAEKP